MSEAIGSPDRAAAEALDHERNVGPVGPRGEFGVGERRATPGDVRRPRCQGEIGAYSVAGSPAIRTCHIVLGSDMSHGRARCNRQRLSQMTASPRCQ